MRKGDALNRGSGRRKVVVAWVLFVSEAEGALGEYGICNAQRWDSGQKLEVQSAVRRVFFFIPGHSSGSTTTNEALDELPSGPLPDHESRIERIEWRRTVCGLRARCLIARQHMNLVRKSQ